MTTAPVETTITTRCSALPLAWQCPSSQETALGEVVINESNEASEAGNAVHRWAAAAYKQGIELDIAALAREHGCDEQELSMLCAQVRRALKELGRYLDATDAPLMVEVPLSVDIGDGITLVGTGDLVGRSRRTGLVLDYKSGRVESSYEHQLRGYALAAAEVLGEVDEIVMIVAWLRQGVWDVEKLSVAHLKDWATELRRRFRNGSGNFNPGGHCAYCKRRTDCPGRLALVRSSIADLTVAGVPVIEWTAETRAGLGPQIGEMYGKAKLIEKAAQDFRDTLRADIEAHGALSIGGGRQLALTTVNRRTLDTAKAREVLSQWLPHGEIDEATTISLSHAEQLAVAKAEKGKGAQTKRDITAALEASGALFIEQTFSLREQKEVLKP